MQCKIRSSKKMASIKIRDSDSQQSLMGEAETPQFCDANAKFLNTRVHGVISNIVH